VPKDKGERFVLMVTGALAVWNVASLSLSAWRPIGLNKKGLLRVLGQRRSPPYGAVIELRLVSSPSAKKTYAARSDFDNRKERGYPLSANAGKTTEL
jgi:hypothetical protein